MKTKKIKQEFFARPPFSAEDLHGRSNEDILNLVNFFVEANSNEQHQLWKEWFHESKNKFKLDWIQVNTGFGFEIGQIDNSKPVWVTFSFAIIGGKLICFYEATSRYVDHGMVAEYLDKHFPIKYDNGTRKARTCAGNFHTCYNFCKTPN